ncbi:MULTISPECIES: DUF262 domain-containing protein [Okeania]|uniref:DUF262 domain-containing protein n=1 Tax=Okeania hirsuta TaxID=1458930 RepID=A0A3N6P6S2_9CYAN|nr:MULTISPECIES: DUF262 domain-containing protein [Okeania]NET14389.1 DUF262 domain-containing protein [Okeania sp. SIO1H6]NES78812.1 DUF262 domain-containing protein [Okeania sp. SIO1H4]NES92178.1 DUF262 domain-containing protein [Okeania sp. SIO2B9]NET22424.1 DUF262 domain-containing protein [Okeania sp. SIO1H5]NET79218.1 DUF262 domain-containing protein [Okeania sp. SIO1F9]
MSLLPIEQKMWQEKATTKTKNGKYATDIVAKYHSREKRILTEINREKLPSFAEALKKPGYMDLRPFYQRRSRWDKQKQSRLIESFLINIPVPPIILYEQSYNSYEVIDGQQRITAIRDFYDNQLKLTGLEFWSELNGLTYQELDSIIQRGIDRRSISTITIVTESTADPEEAMLLKQLAFERINTGGVDLSKQEVRHCLYHGKFDELLLELSRNPIFAEAWGIPKENDSPDLETNNLYKKMEDAELVLRFFALRNKDYFRGQMEDFLDFYMIKSTQFSDKDIELLREIFLETIELANQLYEETLFKPFGAKKQVSYKAYYDAVMVGLSQHLSHAELLISKKSRVIEETKKLFEKDKSRLFTGGGKTKADIQKRMELFNNMLLRVIGE